jgi:endonuclease/exonuclease/phosphatase family metal-dependent hydrolase
MGSRLRILSANLLNGRADPEALCDLVRSLNVDVAGFQELAPEQAEAISDVLPFGALYPARDYHGMGIALRRPASLDRVRLPLRDALIARLSSGAWSGLSRPLDIVNVHVTAPQVWPFWRTWSERRGQLRGLLAHLDTLPEARITMIGDFNATPNWPLYRRLVSRIADAAHLDAKRRGVRPVRTWGPYPTGPRLFRIDHAFVRRTEVENLRVVRVPGSDHSAVVVDVGSE